MPVIISHIEASELSRLDSGVFSAIIHNKIYQTRIVSIHGGGYVRQDRSDYPCQALYRQPVWGRVSGSAWAGVYRGTIAGCGLYSEINRQRSVWLDSRPVGAGNCRVRS